MKEIGVEGIEFRIASKNDYEFLKKVYFESREKELQQVSEWSSEMKSMFLSQQFFAQDEYYRKNYVGAHFLIIKKGPLNIGRLYIDYEFEGNIRIIDIAILSKFRNKGFGSSVLKWVLKEAKQQKKKVTIHVESFNPAKELYLRLGFRKISETNGVYHLYEWNQLI